MKRITLILFVLGLVYCENTTPKITDVEIKEAISFFIDSVVNKAIHGENYIIIPEFDADLTEKDFFNLVDDSLLTKEDVDFMKIQYYKLKQIKIKDFCKEKYISKLNSSEPKRNGQVSYSMDPPLFTKDKKHFIVYSKTFFWAKDEIKWDDLYFIFIKKGGSWELEGYITRPK